MSSLKDGSEEGDVLGSVGLYEGTHVLCVSKSFYLTPQYIAGIKH